MRKGERTRRTLLQAGSRLFQRRGYAATGLNDIVAVSGAPKGSLYFHFPDGKEQLAEEALHESTEAVALAIEQVLESSDSLDSAIKRFGDLLADSLRRSEYRDGCPVGTVTLEMAAESERIREACAKGFERWSAVIARYLERTDASADEARSDAALLICAFEGALMLARAQHTTEPLEHVTRKLGACLGGRADV